MKFAFTPEAMERPKRTMEATATLHEHARLIAQTCAEARQGEMVLAVVEQDGAFGGTAVSPLEHMGERLGEWDDGRWALSFPPRAGVEEIDAQCLRMARLAQRRSEAMQR